MSDISLKIVNIDQIVLAFAKGPQRMRRALLKATNQSLLTIGRKAAQNAPVLTGNLRSSILDPDRGLTLATDSMLSGSVGSGVGYGAFVEQGTRFMRAQPFLGPAVQDTNEQVNQFFTDAVSSVFSDIAKDAL